MPAQGRACASAGEGVPGQYPQPCGGRTVDPGGGMDGSHFRVSLASGRTTAGAPAPAGFCVKELYLRQGPKSLMHIKEGQGGRLARAAEGKGHQRYYAPKQCFRGSELPQTPQNRAGATMPIFVFPGKSAFCHPVGIGAVCACTVFEPKWVPETRGEPKRSLPGVAGGICFACPPASAPPAASGVRELVTESGVYP